MEDVATNLSRWKQDSLFPWPQTTRSNGQAPRGLSWYLHLQVRSAGTRLNKISGLAVSKTDQVLAHEPKESETVNGQLDGEEDMSGDEAQALPVGILKDEAKFDTITVWGHDRLPAADDSFVKGIEEWIALAEAVCISL